MCQIHLEICLVFHSILDLLLETPSWASFYSSCYIILSYLVKNSIQRKMNRRGEKHIGAGREKSPSFTKITRETNKKQWRANNRYYIYIYLDNQSKSIHIFGKSSFLNLETSTMIQTLFNFSPLLMIEFGSICRCLAFPRQIHQWIHNGI